MDESIATGAIEITDKVKDTAESAIEKGQNISANPAVFLGIAVGIGALAARFLKSSSKEAYRSLPVPTASYRSQPAYYNGGNGQGSYGNGYAASSEQAGGSQQ